MGLSVLEYIIVLKYADAYQSCGNTNVETNIVALRSFATIHCTKMRGDDLLNVINMNRGNVFCLLIV